MKASVHCHPESPLTGSTLARMVDKAKELGREYFSYTDNGHLSSAFKAYNAAKKKGLKPILGIEFYFKDPTCQFTSGTSASKAKYFTGTLYAQDQIAYQELCKLVSKTDFSQTTILEEKVNLWSWKDLEHMSCFNTILVVGGSVHCMVGKAMLANQAPIAEKVFLKLKELFGTDLYCAILAESWEKRWCSLVEIKYEDGTKDAILSSDLVTTDKAKRIKAIELVDSKRHTKIISKYSNLMANDVNKDIKKAKLHNGYLPLPGGDASLKVNRFLKALSTKHGVELIVTDGAYYADREDKIVQTMVLGGDIKLHSTLNMKTENEILDYLTKKMNLGPSQAKDIIDNTDKWASQFDNFSLQYEWRLADVGENPLKQAMDIVKENGRMKWNDPKYTERLKYEIDIIEKNPVYALTGYFLPIRDMLAYHLDNGVLPGPGRGSAGGSLLCYLLGITQIDPFKYDLPFNRFFSLERILSKKLPDIDLDLESRELLVGEDGKSGYLYNKYGKKAAQISTRTTVRLKSAILDTNRYFNGKVQKEIELLTSGLPSAPQGINDSAFVFGYEDEDGDHIPGISETSEDLKKYISTRPNEWAIVERAMGITRAYSKHASAFVIADTDISNVLPTKDGNITQYEAKEVELAGLIKYDFLVVKQLKDLRVCMDLINQKNNEKHKTGYFSHDGKLTYIYDLPEIPEVYRSIWDGSTETGFQINSKSMTPFVKNILPENIMDLATILAIVRPGPLDYIDPTTNRTMADEYVMRRKGQSEPDIKILADILPDTYGIFAFQEDLGKVAKKLAGFTDSEAELLRENMAKKKMLELIKMKPKFIEGASKQVDLEIAEKIWEQMVTFGRYGFSIIHAVEYAHITYAGIFLKHFYNLEWWAAVLSNADEKEITGKFWPYVKDMVYPPDINISTDMMAVDYKNSKIRAKLGVVRGMADASIEPIIQGRPYKDIQDFVDKEVSGPSLTRKLIHVGILDSLFVKNSNLIEKLKAYEDAIESKKFKDKIKKAEDSGKKSKSLAPKAGQVPEEYLNLTPLQDAIMKKSVLPSMPIDTHSLGKKYSKVLVKNEVGIPMVLNSRGYSTVLVPGSVFERIESIDSGSLQEDKYFACTCYVIDSKEFSYSNGSKRALKLVVDADGYISERVLWPDYNSGELQYPVDLKKGSIATIFFSKRVGKKDIKINSIVVEA